MSLPLSRPASPPDIHGQVMEAARRRIRVSPQHVNRASSAGHPCERYLVFSRTRWSERQPHSPVTQLVFDGGNVIEDMAIRQLREAGFTVLEQQRSLEWPEYQLTGHIDGLLVADGEAHPFDVKSVNPNDWQRLNTMDDFLSSPRHWVRGWPAQLLLYLLMREMERGFLYLVNKMTFEPKVVWFDLNEPRALDLAEQTLQKLERVNRHVAEGTVPEPIDEPDTCSRCPLYHICLPDLTRDAIRIEDDPEIEALLARRAELEAAHQEFRRIDKAVKERLQGTERAIIGSWLIRGRQVERKGYAVEPGTYWRIDITPLEGQTGGDAA